MSLPLSRRQFGLGSLALGTSLLAGRTRAAARTPMKAVIPGTGVPVARVGDDFEADDFRRHSPRFQGENFAANLALVSKVQELAAAKGCTPGQFALAWTMAQPGVVPIPGTKRRRYLEENAGATEVVLSAADLRAIDAIVPSGAAAGGRYPEAFMPGQTPPLPL